MSKKEKQYKIHKPCLVKKNIKLFISLLFKKNYLFPFLFGIRLFCWNWKLFAESIINKGKN